MTPITHLGAILLTRSGCQIPNPSTDDRLINQYGNLANFILHYLSIKIWKV